MGFAIALSLLHMQMSLAMMQCGMYDYKGWMAWTHCHCPHTFQLLCRFRMPHCTEKPVFVCSFSTLPSHLGKRGNSYICSYFWSRQERHHSSLGSCTLTCPGGEKSSIGEKESILLPKRNGNFLLVVEKKEKGRGTIKPLLHFSIVNLYLLRIIRLEKTSKMTEFNH